MCEIDWEVIVNIIGIAVNGFLAWYIVRTIQKNQSNERSIKDHFMGEVKDLRADYRSFLQSIYSGKIAHGEIVPRLQLLGIKSSDLINPLNYHLSLDRNYFSSLNLELNKIITDDVFYVACRNANDKIELHSVTRQKLIRFQSTYQNRFNLLILAINDAEYKK